MNGEAGRGSEKQFKDVKTILNMTQSRSEMSSFFTGDITYFLNKTPAANICDYETMS